MVNEKGTCGMLYKQEDMPYTKNGLVPDIIMNPAALPSRMTIGQLIECVLAKTCALSGVSGDATPFTGVQSENIEEQLQKLGFEKSGTEVLYSGKTGEQLKSKIFIGPVFYYRLKHLVSDKMHSRNSGPYQLLTRQPSEGRQKGGGLRVGEMEYACLLAHGSVQFLKERTFDSSDKYVCWVCKDCGMFAIANPVKNIFRCQYCPNSSGFNKVNIPYATKLLLQELMTMNISSKLLT